MTKILIIDDDEIFSRQLSLYIDRMGYECTCAPDMKTGLEKATTSYFDVIFLDVILPGQAKPLFIFDQAVTGCQRCLELPFQINGNADTHNIVLPGQIIGLFHQAGPPAVDNAHFIAEFGGQVF